MNAIFHKPFITFWAVIPVIISIGVANSNETLDINIHDTYYVIHYNILSYLFALLFGLIGFGYWIMVKLKRRLLIWLNAIHIITTWVGIIGILTSPLLFGRTYPEPSVNSFFYGVLAFNLIIVIFVLLIITGQLCYLANLSIGLIKRSK